jgi:hypothetical protein
MHQSLTISQCAALDIFPPTRKATAKILVDLLAAINRGDSGLVVPFTGIARQAPGAHEMNAPFCDLLDAAVAYHNAGGPASAVRSLMYVLLDATTTSPVQAYLQQCNPGAACRALEVLAALTGPEAPFSFGLIHAMQAINDDGILPCRFSAALSAVLACATTEPEGIRRLLLAALAFFRAVCLRVLQLGAVVPPPLDDSCATCTSDCADFTGKYLVAFRVRPCARRDTPLPICARTAVLRLLVRDCEQRDLQALPSVEEYGTVMFARGQWVGEAGLRAAREFARCALPAIFANNIDPQVAPSVAAVDALYEADVLFDWLGENRSPDVGRQGLMCFGHPPFRAPGCLFHEKVAVAGAAATCNKVNRLDSKIRLGPGCMPISCPHRVCYGFVILDNAESPRYMFDALRQYFPFPPEVVCYDSACSLSKFSLARNPSLFRDVLFVIDRFHQVVFTPTFFLYVRLC